MPISASDVISLSQARANLSELADISAGKVKDARSTLSALKHHRTIRTAG